MSRRIFNTEVDLLNGNIWKSLIIFAIPLLISNIFQQLYNTMDTLIVGNFLGDTSLAAIGASTAIYELLVGFALGIGNGMGIVIARSYGSKKEDLLKRAVAGSIVVGIFVTLVITIISKLFLFPMLELLKTPENIIKEAYSYISVVTLFVGVMFTYNLCAGLLRAIGNSVIPLFFLILSSIVNVILDILFITQFNMGIQGAAVATVISQGLSALLCSIYILRKAPILVPERKHFIFKKSLYQELITQGLSMGCMMAIVYAGTVILQAAINGLGYLVIAGHVTARKLNSFCLMPIPPLALSISTFVSQNKGANQGYRIRKAVRYGNLLSITWGVIITIILAFTAPVLVKFLSGSNEKVIIENGSLYLRLNAPFYPVLGVLLNLRYSLQGIGKKIVPLISSIMELVGKTVVVWLLIPRIGYYGVILCEPIIWCFMCIQLIFTFYRNPFIRESKERGK